MKMKQILKIKKIFYHKNQKNFKTKKIKNKKEKRKKIQTQKILKF